MARTKATSAKYYKIEFVDRILDPVHGFIDVTQVEKAVSYTHLDVYKRQEWNFAAVWRSAKEGKPLFDKI